MGKKGGWLSCVARPKRKENKYKKTRKSQKLCWKHKDESDSSEDVETAMVNPAPPSPKPEAKLIDPVIEEARDGYSVKEKEKENENENEGVDAPDSHSAGKDTENGDGLFVKEAQNGDGLFVVEEKNEDYVNDLFTEKHTEDGDGYSAVEADNEDDMNDHSAERDTDDGDGYSVVEADNEDGMNDHSAERDTDDGDGYSVVEADNEDGMNGHSERDTGDGDEYSEVEIYSDVKDTDDDHVRLDYSTGFTTAAAAEEDVAAAAAEEDVAAAAAEEDVVAGEIVQLATAIPPPVNKSKEEVAALKIQSVFRGYMARRSFRAVKGVMRLQTLVRGQPVKRQASTTLNCMQSLARVQHQVLARRIRMSVENQAFQRQLQLKHDREKSKASNWDDRTKSKEEVQEQEQRQQLAAIRRERAFAYAYNHQQPWRNSPKQATQTPMDPYNPQWGWNWLEKWMAARPWENKTISEELNSEPPSAKSVTALAQKARRDLKLDQLKSSQSPKNRTRTPGRLSVLSSPRTTPKSASVVKSRTPNSSRRSVHNVDDDDTKSTRSTRSERHRRHSSMDSGNRDDESRASLPTPPSSMSPTSSSNAKSHSSTVKKDSVGSAKKRITIAGSPSAERRHSEPPNTPRVH